MVIQRVILKLRIGTSKFGYFKVDLHSNHKIKIFQLIIKMSN